MKRTPLVRKTPMSRGNGFRGQQAVVSVTDEAAGIDFAAAAKALNHQRASAEAERTFAPVPEVSERAAKPKSTGFPAAVRQIILERDGYACARCGIPVDTSSVGYSLQHRDNRGMGGTTDPSINTAPNGLTLCGSGTTGCHGQVEANPEQAQRFGYAVESWAQPASVPVFYDGRGWMFLTMDGRLSPMLATSAGLTPGAGSPPDAHHAAIRKDALP